MPSEVATERILTAPDELGLESRVAFRRAALEALEGLPDGDGRLILDLRGTRSVDSAGLTTLMLIQRRAAARRQVVRLRGALAELRVLLVLTKMDELFELEPDRNGESP